MVVVQMKRMVCMVSVMLSAYLLVGCASTTSIGEQQVAHLTQWTLAGRVSIQQGKTAHHGRLSWAEKDKVSQIDLVGPFGQGGMKLKITPFSSELQAAGRQYMAADPEQLIAAATGDIIPVMGLKRWLLGIPNRTGRADVIRNPAGVTLTIIEDGWTIHYTEWSQVGAYTLPVRLSAERGALKIRVVIQDWQLPRT